MSPTNASVTTEGNEVKQDVENSDTMNGIELSLQALQTTLMLDNLETPTINLKPTQESAENADSDQTENNDEEEEDDADTVLGAECEQGDDNDENKADNIEEEEELEEDEEPKRRGRPPKKRGRKRRTSYSPKKIRRTSRTCRPNSLIFTEDTTTQSPIRRKRVKKEEPEEDEVQDTEPEASIVTETPLNSRTPLRRSAALANKHLNLSLSSRRSAANVAVRRAVSTLKRRGGRPPKRPQFVQEDYDDDDSESPKEGAKPLTPYQQKKLAILKETGKNLSPYMLKKYGPEGPPPADKSIRKLPKMSPYMVKKYGLSGARSTVKMTPILTAILSGQPLAQTRSGRPKGRPRKLPSLEDAVNDSLKRVSPSSGKCNCDTRYKEVLVNLEQQLESRFMDQTKKVSEEDCFPSHYILSSHE